MEGQSFKVEREGPVAWLVLSRPEKRNSMNMVIAAVHGHCIGGGVDLLSACDVRMATRDAVFAIRETKVAVIADLGTFQRLPHLIGHGRFRELALTGRDFTAEEAMKMGFITHFCETKEELYEYVAQKNAAALLSEDLMEAVKAFTDKRPLMFKGR